MSTTGILKIDQPLVSRLLLGALSEHEQRLLAIHAIRLDPKLRVELLSFLRPFEMFDLDLVEEYARALPKDADPADARQGILERARQRAPDLDEVIRNFTFGDVFQLGPTTRKLFSWSMAELLLERSLRPGSTQYSAKTNLYLAMMVIDVVEILGVTRHSPHLPDVIEDVRKRIQAAARAARQLDQRQRSQARDLGRENLGREN